MTEAKVDEIAVLSGVDLEQMKADMNSPKIEKALNDMSDLAGQNQRYRRSDFGFERQSCSDS